MKLIEYPDRNGDLPNSVRGIDLFRDKTTFRLEAIHNPNRLYIPWHEGTQVFILEDSGAVIVCYGIGEKQRIKYVGVENTYFFMGNLNTYGKDAPIHVLRKLYADQRKLRKELEGATIKETAFFQSLKPPMLRRLEGLYGLKALHYQGVYALPLLGDALRQVKEMLRVIFGTEFVLKDFRKEGRTVFWDNLWFFGTINKGLKYIPTVSSLNDKRPSVYPIYIGQGGLMHGARDRMRKCLDASSSLHLFMHSPVYCKEQVFLL